MASAIDVLIPCFNAARYVSAAIDSVLSQNYPAARIIVVDDGSTDASATVIRSYGPPVEYYHQSNGGISSARNAAAAHARADFVAFLDADDLWTTGSLATRIAYLTDNPNLDGVFGALVQFVSPELPASLASRYRPSTDPGVARFAGTFLARRPSFIRAGGFNEALRTGEMVEWLARAEALGLRFGTVSELVLRRRIHDSNTVLKSGTAHADYLRAVRGALQSGRGGPSGSR